MLSTPKLTNKTRITQLEKPTKQNEEIRNKLLRTYKKEDLFKAHYKYSGFGITGELTLEIDDIVGVLKKADPCGNTKNWFVDNGSMNSLNIIKQKSFNFFNNKYLKLSKELYHLTY
jgi:hypothetical protein